MARGRGVGVIAEGVGVPFGEDLHQPAIKVIDWVIHDWFEAAVIFSMSFFNVVFQSYAEVSVLAAQAHLLRSEHFYVLHRNFCDAIRAPVQFLFFERQAVDVKFFAKFRSVGGPRDRLDQFERFWFGTELKFSCGPFNDGCRPRSRARRRSLCRLLRSATAGRSAWIRPRI